MWGDVKGTCLGKPVRQGTKEGHEKHRGWMSANSPRLAGQIHLAVWPGTAELSALARLHAKEGSFPDNLNFVARPQWLLSRW